MKLICKYVSLFEYFISLPINKQLNKQVISSEEIMPLTVSVPDIPGQESVHDVSISNTFYIDQSDFRVSADKG